MDGQSFINRFIRFLVRRSQKQYPSWQLLLSILSGAMMELVLVPAVLIVVGKKIDATLGLVTFPLLLGH